MKSSMVTLYLKMKQIGECSSVDELHFLRFDK